jgi:septation ring formation regulator EzrA
MERDFDFEEEVKRITPIREKLKNLLSQYNELEEQECKIKKELETLNKEIRETNRNLCESPLSPPDVDEYLTKAYYCSLKSAQNYLEKFNKRIFTVPVYSDILERFKKELTVPVAEAAACLKKIDRPAAYKELYAYKIIKTFYNYFGLDAIEFDNYIEYRISELESLFQGWVD